MNPAATQRQLICPLCHQPLTSDDLKQWGCAQGHRYDAAKQGYLNLHLVQHKRSRQPGDDKAMVQARSRFLNGDFYQPISDAVCQLIPSDTETLVDIGCGEGYYTDAIKRDRDAVGNLPPLEITGIDISKDAIIAASRRSKAIDWLVASGANPPLANHNSDCVISLFTPLMTESYQQLLRTGGSVVLVHTGGQHLDSLRHQLYDDVKQDIANIEVPMKDAGFKLLDEQKVQFEITLAEQQQLSDLLAMTPHYWRAKPERKQQLLQKMANGTPFDTFIDIRIMIFKRYRDLELN